MMKIIALIILLLFNSVASHKFSYDEFREFLSVKKRENPQEFEQCSPVNFIMGQLGVVNVLAFLDNSWPYSHKQATLFKLLKDRLNHSGLPEALFYVIITGSSPNSLEYAPESEIEKEAWEGVAPEEATELSSGLLTYESLDKTISPDIFVIEDTEELGIWRELHGSRDQILVIDRCGKLAYQVIVPWSILHFPYVKAAILSTHKDDPCGPCDSYATVIEFDDVDESEKTVGLEPDAVTEVEMEATTIENSARFFDSNPEENEKMDYDLPGLRIIMHAPHTHLNSDAKKKHEYLVLDSEKPNYHGHLDVSNDNYGEEIRSEMETSVVESIAFGKDESPGLFGEVADFWRDIPEYERIYEGSGEVEETTEMLEISTTPENLMDEAATNSAEFTVEEEESRSRIIAHYSKLLPWIYYVLD